MEPDTPNPNMQGVYGPTPQGGAGMQPPPPPVEPLKSGKKKMVLVFVATFVLIGVIGILLVLPDRQNTPPKSQTTNGHETEAEGPQPATAVTTEQDNNAVSQEIGNLNDDQDFPTDQLSDDNLEL